MSMMLHMALTATDARALRDAIESVTIRLLKTHAGFNIIPEELAKFCLALTSALDALDAAGPCTHCDPKEGGAS